MNPINNLNAKNEKLEAQLKNLEKEHSKLVSESVIIERMKDEYEDSIIEACKYCAMKGTSECDKCALHDTAVRRELW